REIVDLARVIPEERAGGPGAAAGNRARADEDRQAQLGCEVQRRAGREPGHLEIVVGLYHCSARPRARPALREGHHLAEHGIKARVAAARAVAIGAVSRWRRNLLWHAAASQRGGWAGGSKGATGDEQQYG